MLTIFRRHVKRCPHREKGRDWRKCKCPISVEGRLPTGKLVRKSLNTANWAYAQELAFVLETSQNDKPPVTVEDGTRRFMAECQSRHLSAASLKKYRVLLEETRMHRKGACSPTLLDYARAKGIRFLKEFTPDDVRNFRAQWKDGALAGNRKLGRLRSFFAFAVDSGWIDTNPAKPVKPSVVKNAPTIPLTDDELHRLYAAIPTYRQNRTARGLSKESDYVGRLHALLLVMEYSGLRIGDAVSLSTDDLEGDRLFLDTAKTGVKVYIPLPPHVITALRELPLLGSKYFFWSRAGKVESVACTYRRSLRALARHAELEDVHPHRFRDTMATRLLQAGVPTERVAAILGHTDIRVTQHHYSAWVQSRQDQAEDDVRKVWAQQGKD